MDDNRYKILKQRAIELIKTHAFDNGMSYRALLKEAIIFNLQYGELYWQVDRAYRFEIVVAAIAYVLEDRELDAIFMEMSGMSSVLEKPYKMVS